MRFSLKFLTLFILFLSATVLLCGAEAADSAEAFMSATFGLSSARTQKRMENSDAVASDFIRDGRLTMKGLFESRPAIFVFGFHAKKGLNHKAAYIASSGDAQADRAFYDALREAYNASFGKTDERAAENIQAKGRLMLRNAWKPNQYTTIALSYNPAITERFPGDSPGGRPIHLLYTYTKWTTATK
ncbi:MAG: hypothetical protein LBT15_07360 [Synergistaceae bacterium]|nr:hypothetical protein [Synergistaceae bacterium]